MLYQTLHLFSGFINDPLEQPKSAENSGIFKAGPITRKFEGACESVITRLERYSSRVFEHQTLA